MRRITVLDGYTLNPGDVDWKLLENLGDLKVYDRTSEDKIVYRAKDSNCILVNKVPMSGATIAKLPKLSYLGVLATGFDVVDVTAASKRGIVVTNIPGYGTYSVAQHTLALILEFARGIGLHDQQVHAGLWEKSEDWCFSSKPMFELNGKTLGIIGLGRIGIEVAKICSAIGMKIVASTPSWPSKKRLSGLSIRALDITELCREADVISLHCPLVPSTYNLIDEKLLALMKPGALLVNTSRGGLVDSLALANYLSKNKIGGAALDVLDIEPARDNHPLINCPNCLITPHIGWNAIEARRRLIKMAFDNLDGFLKGHPINVVS